jgi:hypothetical protein
VLGHPTGNVIIASAGGSNRTRESIPVSSADYHRPREASNAASQEASSLREKSCEPTTLRTASLSASEIPGVAQFGPVRCRGSWRPPASRLHDA